MTARTDEGATVGLVRRLALLLDRQITSSGHLAQIVVQEHLGVCSVKGCAPSCLEAQRAMIAAAEYVTAHEQPAASQRSMFDVGEEVAG